MQHCDRCQCRKSRACTGGYAAYIVRGTEQSPEELPDVEGKADAVGARRSQNEQPKSLLRAARAKFLSGQFSVVLLELCCEDNSKIVEHVPQGALAL